MPRDERITLQWGDAAHAGEYLDWLGDGDDGDGRVDVINLQFVAHELPVAVTLDIIREAHRLLKPGTGQLWFCEMDFEAPAYAAQRANPWLFGLIRATEPFLDEYADGQGQIWQCLRETFAETTIAPATGRHFAVVATKGATENEDEDHRTLGKLNDLRFDANGEYRVKDTHLQVWENKKAERTVVAD